MKETVFLALGLTVVGQVGLYAQAAMNLDDLVRRGDSYLHPQTFAPYTGPVAGMWASQTFRERGTLVNGRWDGLHEWYHENGRLSLKEIYADGVLDGPSEVDFKSGQLSVKETYKDGQLDGPYESYWARGRLAERGNWTAGRECGEWVSFGRSTTYSPCPMSNDHGGTVHGRDDTEGVNP